MGAEPWRAFGPTWFATHQRRLVGALNRPVLGRPLRQACRLGHAHPLDAIGPHWDRVALDVRGRRVPYGPPYEVTYRTTFRTHPKFAKRVYYAARPIWWALHAWDQAVANPFVPAWNLGYDVLTTYPDPDPEVTTVDGEVRRDGVDEAFSTIRNGAGTGNADTTAAANYVTLAASTTTDQFSALRHSYFLYDTTPLGGGANISAVDLSLWGNGFKDANLGTTPIHIASSNPASNTGLANGDYLLVGRVSFASITNAAWSTAGVYNVFGLNASGIANIDRTGISKFSAQLGWDLDGAFTGTWSSSAQNFFQGQYADTAGLTQDPRLQVTYTIVTWHSPIIQSAPPTVEVVASGFAPPDFPEA